MKFLIDVLKKDTAASAAISNIKSGKLPFCVSGLSNIHKALMCLNICETANSPVIIITPTEASATELTGDLISLGCKAAMLPVKDFCFSDTKASSKEYEYRRINTLSEISDGQISVLVVPCEAALQYTVPPEKLKNNMIKLEAGDEFPIEKLVSRLLSAGYSSVTEIENVGQFSRRGGILDIFAVNMSAPVRIEFWGDEIDSISEFDLSNQRRTEQIKCINISQAGEIVADAASLSDKITDIMLSGKKGIDVSRISRDLQALGSGITFSLDRWLPLIYGKATVFDYLPNAVILASEISEISDVLDGVFKRYNEDYMLYSEAGFIIPGFEFMLNREQFFEKFEKAVFLENFPHSEYPFVPLDFISAEYKTIPPWKGDISVLTEDAESTVKSGGSCLLLAGKEKSAEVIYNELEARGANARLYLNSYPDTLPPGISVVNGGLSSGFRLSGTDFMCVTAAYIHSDDKPQRRIKNDNAVGSLDELKTGDYVVHSVYGIGVFAGIHKINNKGIIKDYIKINYAKTDVLYVPVTQLDLISKYIGSAETGNVRLNRLGSQEWQKTRARVKHAVREMAKELTALYAKRMSVKGYAFSPDTDLQRDFESKFPYAETPDQIKSSEEIKADMQRTVPMDRLLCGDVGFGKTEVALRAAFKCVSEGKQCAVLVPTTILAFQHYNTVMRRFGDMPVNIKMLSRFVPQKQQDKIVSDLALGKVDLVIGTHRLISNDVKFKDLGLAIIDEEQRFGVAQKEKLKQQYPAVDVLTLSATPIPRTLNMAMSGLRDMSSIDEAPAERLPVQSYVIEYNRAVVIDAIRKELRRSGQVYYLYNRTHDIERKAILLSEALPEARIATAHGKMSEDELSAIWKKLLNHETDILVCTTIIETGVDVPNANTLIIEDADCFGLSQLHQLRGRVGRSSRRAYAYFCFRENKALSEIAEKRLEAIREFTEFGAGFKIAMRDLELRGAGNILGGEQHGNMEAVGYDMYIKLLNQAVNEENGIAVPEEKECTVDLNISAYIPERYIESLPARLGIYKRIAAIENEPQKRDVLDELIDRFGEPPKSVIGLIEIALLRRKAAALGIYEITENEKCFVLKVNAVTGEQVDKLMPKFGKRIVLRAEDKPYYEILLNKNQTRQQLIEEIAEAL